MKAPHFRMSTPGDRGPASQDDAAAAPSLINNFRSSTPLLLMSEATCGGAQRNHPSVAGGEFSKGQKPLKNKSFSRSHMSLQSRESPVRSVRSDRSNRSLIASSAAATHLRAGYNNPPRA